MGRLCRCRILVQKLRRLQKETYLIGKVLDDSLNDDPDLAVQYDQSECAVSKPFLVCWTRHPICVGEVLLLFMQFFLLLSTF